MRVVRTPMDGFKTCGRPRIFDPDHGELGAREEDCPGYKSEPVKVVREETSYTFADDKSDGVAGMDHNAVSRSIVRILPADPENAESWMCVHCQHPMASFSLEARADYVHLSDSHPDELRRRSLKQDRQAEEQLSIAERSAIALEALAAAPAAELAAMREHIARLEARLEAGNGAETAEEPESTSGPVRTRPKAQRA